MIALQKRADGEECGGNTATLAFTMMVETAGRLMPRGGTMCYLVDRQQVTITWPAVDIGVAPVGGLDLCLTGTGSTRPALVHYAGSQWESMAGSRDDAPEGQVCAAGVTAFSPFAVEGADVVPRFAYSSGCKRIRCTSRLSRPCCRRRPVGRRGKRQTDAAGCPTGGRISGTPAALHPAATYTLVAMDRDVDRATLMFIPTIERAR